VLKQHDLFSALGEGEVEEIAKMMMIAIPKGEYLFRQDDPATCFFIIG
jgi:CRP-like cAMP-binding protein